jgi:hypothetical protein
VKVRNISALARDSISVVRSVVSRFKDCSRLMKVNRHCGIVVRVPGYRSRGPGFDSRRYQIF